MNASHIPTPPRVDLVRVFGSGPAKAMLALQAQVEQSGLEHSLLELVKIRASQINGCAYCIDMHTKDARAAGETEQRIYALSGWRETPFFTERERAALDWTEAVTRLAETHVSDDVHARVREVLDEAALVALTWAVVAINAWNRLAVAFRSPVGTYRPAGAAPRAPGGTAAPSAVP
jgi:AhpD family alkylhydroperoxidase